MGELQKLLSLLSLFWGQCITNAGGRERDKKHGIPDRCFWLDPLFWRGMGT